MFTAFGLRVASEVDLPPLATVGGRPDLVVRLAPAAEVRDAFSGPVEPRARSTGLADGCEFVTERGVDGDLTLRYGDEAAARATFHLDRREGVVRCAPADVHDAGWRRFLLDTVLGTAALVHGFEMLHSGACVLASGLVAIVAGSGGGKSTLVAELVARGHDLFTDDLLALSRDERVVGHPGPALMNLAPRAGDVHPAARIGEVVAEIDGESWTAVPRRPPAPTPLYAVALLERGGGGAPTVDSLPQSPTLLLAHSLTGSHDPHRLATRFELFADLAAQARVFRLRVPDTLSPAAIADLLEEAVGG